MKTRHILLGVGALAALYGASYMVKLHRFSTELETVTKVTIHKVSLNGIELRIDVTLKNPSGGSLRVKQPFVKLIYKDSTVATSQVKNTDISIGKFSEVKMEPVMITISFMTLATKFPALLTEYRNAGQINMVVKTITTINDTLPYTKTDVMTLGTGKKA